MTITTPATIRTIREHKDGSLGLVLTTPVLTAQDRKLLAGLQGTDVDLELRPTGTPPVPQVKLDGRPGQRTQSQRIRQVLYLLWLQEPADLTAEEYYEHRTEQIIDWLKSKLAPGAQRTV